MSKSPNSFKPFLIAILGLTLVIGLIKIDYNKTLSNPLNASDETVSFEITEGELVAEILNNLKEANIISQKETYYAKFYLRNNNLESKLQAGQYEIPLDLNMKELFETLQLGINHDTWVTIPEGLRKDEIADILEDNLETTTFSKAEFLKLTTDSSFIKTLDLNEEITDLEGFLFPDKYLFPLEMETENVLKELVRNFKEKVGDNYTYEEIILASIVEREGYNSNDRPIIAGIIIKRLQEGWLLQTDATLLYPVKDWKHDITVEDKESDNPYNTYRNIGLPPTPICNPGLESIQAVQNPKSSDYYYYIHDTDGNPHYGRDLNEHNANVIKYLR